MDFNLREAAQNILPYADQVALEGGGGQVVANIISSLLSVALIIAAVLVLLYLIWGAIEWISSSGDSGKIEKARNRIMQAIIGLIVLAAVIAVLALMQTLLGVTLIKMTGI
jgi:ABC-type multidrug transport system fused ATPase/permease subunit